MSGRPAVFLDRDGVLNELIVDPVSGLPESPLRIEDVRLAPGVAEAAARLARAGFALVCASNQPAAAKGKVSIEQLLAIHQRVIELLADAGVRLEVSRLCLHHPDGVVAELTGACPCRKPAPGMLLEVTRELTIDLDASWMVGDTDADVLAGHAAGCQTVLIDYPGSAHKRIGVVKPDIPAADFQDAATRILAEVNRNI